MKRIALLLLAKHLGCSANHLENNLDRSLFSVVACYGQGNTLALLAGTKDDKLSCLCLLRNKGRLDIHHNNGGIKHFFVNYSIHFSSLSAVNHQTADIFHYNISIIH